MLALPQTFVNDSGASVAPLVSFYKIELADLLVVCDDINLQFGQLRIRRRGSDGLAPGSRPVPANGEGGPVRAAFAG